ncbi:MAG TPA: hypothetical protein VMA74_04575, partial [Dyella sp.]|uniref:hypothetical protein n=1 Tax=Dyella sp. TaxID=1869338 RepID=UPI002B5129AC
TLKLVPLGYGRLAKHVPDSTVDLRRGALQQRSWSMTTRFEMKSTRFPVLLALQQEKRGDISAAESQRRNVHGDVGVR